MKLVTKIVPVIAMLALMASCGGSSSSTPAAAAGGDGEGVAAVTSIASLPSVDLQNYDASSSASSNEAAPISKSLGVSKSFGSGMRDVGGASRAGCEANMHKQEVFRMSQTVQLDRCYPKAMEKAGFITIPTGSYAYYKISKPPMDDEDKTKMCDGIPAERATEKAKCLEGSEGPSGGNMLMRIGNIDNSLNIDMCQGAEGSEALISEASYAASGSRYTAGVIRIGSWGGNTEKSNFNLIVDLGTTGKVEDEIATIGTDGLVNAAGQMSGGFGSGAISFEKVGSDSSNIVKGAFKGGFTDPFTSTTTSFTGKTYARFNATSGCAKFSFTGSMPGMLAKDMVPFNISQADLSDFLASLGAELGIVLTVNNYTTKILCPNPNFDPENPSANIKPMVAAPDGQACQAVTNTGVECFSITNGTTVGDFGENIVTQVFTKTANTGSTYYDVVNAFVIADLSETISPIVFARNWDCAGNFTTLDFSQFTPAQLATASTAMEACRALEEKARGNQGMGGYDCGKQEQMNGVNTFAEEGGGDESFGQFGGNYNVSGYGDCPNTIPTNVFVNMVNADQKQYCIPTQGACATFTFDGGNLADNINVDWGTSTLVSMQHGVDSANIVWKNNQSNIECTAIYLQEKPEFGAPPTFGGEKVEGAQPGDPGYVPQPCIDAGITTPGQACMQICQKPGANCR